MQANQGLLLSHEPDTLAYDDTSVNGAIGADPFEDDGEPWDCDAGYEEDGDEGGDDEDGDGDEE